MFKKMPDQTKSKLILKSIKALQANYASFCYLILDSEVSESAEKEVRTQLDGFIVMIRKLCEELSLSIEQELINQRKSILNERDTEEEDDYD